MAVKIANKPIMGLDLRTYHDDYEEDAITEASKTISSGISVLSDHLSGSNR